MAQSLPRSPLAPASFPALPVIGGVRFAAAAAGVKYQGRTDVMLAQLDPGSSVAGVFTRSATRSAPVLDCQSKLGGAPEAGAAILVNSGNSNAFTGHYGQTSVAEITAAVAEATGVPQSRVFTASTGVIGEPLPHDRIVAKIDELKSGLAENRLEDAAQAIMTTDTFAKGATAQVEIEGKTVSIAGIAKGSGMIAPDMATMLVYIFTDAAYEQTALQDLLSGLNDRSFNCITVDSDTSTSDSLLLCATGASGVDATGNAAFADALSTVMLDLAHQVVRDGEGASKFVEVQVTGAASEQDAKIHGLAIANSPLVKTAIAGEDPNWGRVVMAIGKSGAAADRDLLSIWFGDVLVAEKGWVSPDYREEDAAKLMKQDEILIRVDLGLGDGKSTVWTCDLTHQYIEINADYRS
jgi:glutamate N-acetyltransferase/amino-acid N-acetyltransferase